MTLEKSQLQRDRRMDILRAIAVYENSKEKLLEGNMDDNKR